MTAAEYQERRLNVALGNVLVTFIQGCLIMILIDSAVKYHTVLTQYAPLWIWITFIVIPLWFVVAAITRRIIKADIAWRDRQHKFDPRSGDFLS